MSFTITKSFSIVIIIALFSVLSFAVWSFGNCHRPTIPPPSPQPQDKAVPTLEETVTINGEKFAFDPSKAETVRPDLLAHALDILSIYFKFLNDNKYFFSISLD
jgi:hypothetical protein